MEVPWRVLLCSRQQVNLKITLSCGQSFRWNQTGENEWTSVLGNRVWRLKQDEEKIMYKVFEPAQSLEKKPLVTGKSQESVTGGAKRGRKKQEKVNQAVADNVVQTDPCCYVTILKDYLQLDVDLEELYKAWSKADVNFKAIASDFEGVRILRQDPTENLFSFICSSNNNISRITGLVQRLCEKYGQFVMSVDGLPYYSFPSVSALAGAEVEQQLRELGFGYRAKFITQSAQYILQHQSADWLHSLRKATYQEAHEALCKLPGVGAKVADCVCLMSLDKTQAIPVDTHVWQIAARFYLPNLNTTKSLTDKLYTRIGDHFRMLFGSYAGWAHSVLFSADLKKFQDLKSNKSSPEKESSKKTGGKKEATGKTGDIACKEDTTKKKKRKTS